MNAFIKIFVPVGLVIGLTWFAWWAAVEKMTPHKAEQGQIGDLFGGINALFSGLALAGVVTAVVLQSRELLTSAAGDAQAERRTRTHSKRDQIAT